MPEGPEIQRNADNLRGMVGKVIEEAEVLSGRYMRNPIANFDALVGQTVKSINVKGKLIGLLLDQYFILSTAGMSGWWTDTPTPSRFKRIKLVLHGHAYYFVDMRNFGTFKVVSHQEGHEKFYSLGVDIFRRDDGVMPELKTRLKKFSGTQLLCEALLDQRIFAGVGNYIRADAMYLSHLDPRMPAKDLTDEQLEVLWLNITNIAMAAATLGHGYISSCYGRRNAENGELVKSFVDKKKRTVWHV